MSHGDDSGLDDSSAEPTDPSDAVPEPRVHAPSLPASVEQRFDLLEQIGAGGMGVVYRVRDRRRGQIVALKTLRQIDPAALLRLKNEFRRVADLTHPNLVSVHELLSSDDSWYFTMEYVPGRSLHARLALGPSAAEPSGSLGVATLGASPTATLNEPELDAPRHATSRSERDPGPRLEPDELRRIFVGLARGIRALHTAGMLHCDIKPANVMLSTDGRARLLDFGLVTPSPSANHPSHQPEVRALAGTPSYMAPEQAIGAGASEASDWYAFGTILYECLAGRRPFAGTGSDVLAAKLHRAPEPLPPAALASEPTLAALALGLLAREPAQRPDVAAIFAALGEREREHEVELLPTELIGRREQLAALEHAVQAGRPGVDERGTRAVVVEIYGPSGAGKSAVIDRFLDSAAREPDTVVLRGRCYERESVPYKALDSLIDALTGHLRRLPAQQLEAALPEHVGALVRLFPVLARVPALAARAATQRIHEPDQPVLRRRAFAALKQLLANLSRDVTLVCAIDDVHWGDRDSGRLLNELLAPPDAPWLVLVLGYREERAALSAFLTELGASATDHGSRGSVDRRDLVLARLPELDARRLAAALLSSTPDDPRVARIAAESHGLPLFIEELSRHASVGGELSQVSLEQVVSRRVASLEPDAARLLVAVAIAGRPIPERLAERAAQLQRDLLPLLNLLRANHLVRTSTSDEGVLIEPYHERVRESVLANLEPAGLVAAHRRLAHALEALDPEQAEQLADHWYAAGELEAAGRHAALAGARAAAALAFDAAVGFYTRALECAPADDPSRSELRLAQADALANAGRLTEAADLYLDAARASDDLVSRQLRRRAAEQLLLAGQIGAAMAILTPMLDEAGVPLPRNRTVASLELLGRRFALALRGLELDPLTTAVFDPFALEQIDLCVAVGRGFGSLETRRGAYYLTRAAQLALTLGEPRRAARGLAQLGLLGVQRGDAKANDQARAQLDRALGIGEQLDDPALIGLAKLAAGAAAMMLGRWRDAYQQIGDGAALLEDRCAGVAWELSFAHALAGRVLGSLGRLRELDHLGRGWLRTAEQLGDRYGAAWSRISLSSVDLAAGQVERASASLQAVLDAQTRPRFTAQRQHASVLLAECDRYRGDHAAALRRLEHPERGPTLDAIASIQARASARLGLAAANHTHTEQLAHVERHAKALAKLRRPDADAAAALLRGAAANLARDGKRALAQFEHAQRLYEQADMTLLGAVAKRSRGLLLGGDTGQALVDDAEASLRGLQIVDVARWSAIYCPGVDA